jgi:peptidoglycan/LPS O-acetylase OafA/YrhL
MMACSVILGIAVRMLALQYSFLCVLVMLVVLSRFGRDTGFELLLVASVCSGLAMCHLLNLLNQSAGGLTLYRFSSTLEPIAVGSLAVLLLVTRRRLLAWVLTGYSSLMVILILSSKLFHVPRLPGSTRGTGYAVIYCLMACLLVRWLQNETGENNVEEPTTRPMPRI